MNKEQLKQNDARAALDNIDLDAIIGLGTGSTVNYFIEALAEVKHQIDATVASSQETEKRLRALGIPVIDLNVAGPIPFYIDGADEINHLLQLIKGGGGALTREKIIAAAAQKFICIADETKYVKQLGASYPLPIEVIPMARSFVARELVKLGGDPVYREGFVSDNGHIILDIYHLDILEPIQLEQTINQIPGVVSHGLFAARPADCVLLAGEDGIKKLTLSDKT